MKTRRFYKKYFLALSICIFSLCCIGYFPMMVQDIYAASSPGNCPWIKPPEDDNETGPEVIDPTDICPPCDVPLNDGNNDDEEVDDGGGGGKHCNNDPRFCLVPCTQGGCNIGGMVVPGEGNNGDVVSPGDTYTISGWADDVNGIDKVEMYIDLPATNKKPGPWPDVACNTSPTLIVRWRRGVGVEIHAADPSLFSSTFTVTDIDCSILSPDPDKFGEVCQRTSVKLPPAHPITFSYDLNVPLTMAYGNQIGVNSIWYDSTGNSTQGMCEGDDVIDVMLPEDYPTSTITPTLVQITPTETFCVKDVVAIGYGIEQLSPTVTPTVTSSPTSTPICDYLHVEGSIGLKAGEAIADCIVATPWVENIVETSDTSNFPYGIAKFENESGSIYEGLHSPAKANPLYCEELKAISIAQATANPSLGNFFPTPDPDGYLHPTPFSGGTEQNPKDLGNRIVYYKEANSLYQPSWFNVGGGYFTGCGTLVAEGTTLTMNDSVYLATPGPLDLLPACLGIITCEDEFGVSGDIWFNPESEETYDANFYSMGSIFTGWSTTNRLQVNGSLAAEKTMEFQREYVHLTDPKPAENITYQGALLLHPPEGFYSEKELKFIEWVEISPF